MGKNVQRVAGQLPPATVYGPGFNCYPVALVVLALLALNALLFTVFTTSPHPRADVWRHLDEIVIPFLDGSVGWPVLWSNHHPSPLLHLIQIVNLQYLGFRLDFEAYLGFVFQVATTVLVLYAVFRSIPRTVRPGDRLFCLSVILILSIQLGFNTLEQYTWPLFATVQYLYFFGVLVFLAADRCIRSPGGGNYILLGVLSLVLMLANASYGTIFLVSMIAVLALVSIVDRSWTYFRAMVLLFSVWAVYYGALLFLVPSAPYRPSASMLSVLLHYLETPVAVYTKLALAMFAGLVDIVTIKEAVPASERVLIGLSWVVMLAGLLVFYTYVKRELYRVSVIPLALMCMLLVFAVPALVTRFIWVAGDDWGLTKERYATTFKLVVIGAIWAMLLIKNTSASIKRSVYMRFGSGVAVCAIFAVLGVQGYQVFVGWRQVPEFEAKNRREALAIFHVSDDRENSIRLPFRVSGYGGVRGSLDYLEKYHLGVFADNFPGSPLLHQQVLHRRAFDSAGTSVVTLDKGADTTILNSSGRPLARWATTSGGIEVGNLSEEAIYLRLKVRSPGNREKGVFISPGSDDGRPQFADLLRGQQHLYFVLQGNEEFTIKVLSPAEVQEAELRI